MSVPLTLLGLLEREPSHGYDLKRDYDTYFGRGKPLPYGQVYATLSRLARDGKAIAGPAEPGGGPDRKRYVITDAPAGLVSCAQLARVPALGRCPAGATAAALPRFLDDAGPGEAYSKITWPAAYVSARRLDHLGLYAINVATDGSQSAVEQARTVLESAYHSVGAPPTLGELRTSENTINNAYQQLADVVIVASLAIAGCTLAASVAAGLADRKRPFSLLRLTGARLGMLRRVVVLESAVPLLAVAVVSIGVGFGASAMFATVRLQHPLVAPGAAYYLITGAGIAASLGIIASTFPLLRRITGPRGREKRMICGPVP